MRKMMSRRQPKQQCTPQVEEYGGIPFDLCHEQVGSASIFYLVGGSGVPLILLHGMAGSTRWWRKNIAPLGRASRVHLVDLIGFGYSRGQPFVLSEIADHIFAWTQRLGLDQFDIIGHSMGGYIAADIAARHPQQVNRLVLVDAAAIPLPRSLIRNAFRLAHALRYMPFDFLPVLVGDSLRAGPFTLLRAIRDILRADITSHLEQIEAETLIVWGEYDTLLPVAVGHDLHRALPDAQFVVIKGAGHNPMWDRPQEFNQLVTGFLAGSNGASLPRKEKDRLGNSR
jgi:pimeloyl-ACP methyl ester carboxylesterase